MTYTKLEQGTILDVIQTKVNDYAFAGQMGFQDPATPNMESLIDFHHDLMFYLILVLHIVLWLIFDALYLFSHKDYIGIAPTDKVLKMNTIFFLLPSRNYKHTYYELGWSLIPLIFILSLLAPTFSLLYSAEQLKHAALAVKIIGHQWYWKYEYFMTNKHWGKKGTFLRQVLEEFYPKLSTQVGIHYKFASRMRNLEDLRPGQLRLLTVDNRLHVPTQATIRFLITSMDVIHSWAVPSLGVKVDACPGRLNQVFVYIKRPGVFYGQCSELCGINHYAMPIVVKAEPYVYWLHYHYCMRVRMIFWFVFNLYLPKEYRFMPPKAQRFYAYSLSKKVKRYWWGTT
jgi:cytochrome c oxidase subunit 2